MFDTHDKENWLKVKDTLENQMSAIGFDLWIKPLEIIDKTDNIILLSAPSDVAINQIKKLYSEQLKKAITEVYADVVGFELLLTSEVEGYLKSRSKEVPAAVKPKMTLDSKYAKYTFDNFVVGKCNNIAFAACKSVAENPAGVFNPLFLYGGVGLGKTHLLLSIGNYIAQNNPELAICYNTCENFTNDYLASIRNSKDRSPYAFREKYRNVDVLLIDDIEFISGKDATQEEFFHTFNDLFQNNKQIVVTSDRPPKDFANLEDRLRSRFSMGLIQDLQQPDYETRYEILRKKAEMEKYSVNEEVLEYIAEKVETNIRELEGVLTKVVFFAKISGRPVATLNDAQEALKEQIQEQSEGLTIDSIVDAVCAYYNVSKQDLIGKKKNKEIVDPRQICMYLITELMDTPLKSIGMYFGGRDHTTIMHARDKTAAQVKINSNLKNSINDIKNSIKK